MFSNWLKVYVYNSKKHKVYFLLTILCLAIGITAVLLSTLYFKEEYSFDQWNEQKETIHFVENKGEKITMTGHPFALAIKLKEEYAFVDDYLFYNGYTDKILAYKEKNYVLDNVITSSQNFFDFFPYSFVYGSPSSVFKNPNEIVLEQQKSALLFGEGINPVGEQIQIEDKLYTVVGVYALDNKRSSFMPEAIVNDYQFLTDEQKEAWDKITSNLLVKTTKPLETAKAIDDLYIKYYFEPWAVKSNITLKELLERLEGMLVTKAVLHALPKMHFQSDGAISGTIPEPIANIKLLYVIVGLSWLMLLLSLFNYVNLSLSQALSRAKEVGVRKVLGSTKKNIVKQSLVETTCTVCIAFVLSVVLFLWLLPFSNSFLMTNISVHFIEVALLLVGIYLLVLVFAGLIPALYRAKYRVLNVLKGDFHRSQSGNFIKNTFLVIQFASACWFITGTYIVYKQVNYMTTKDLGFKGDQVISVPFLEDVYDQTKQVKYATFKEEALKIQGVEQVAVATLEYGGTGGSSTINFFPYKEESIMALLVGMEADYFDMMGIQLKEGRFLDSTLANDSIQNIVINEKLLASLGETSIEGLNLSGKVVVGLVQDFHTGGFEYPVNPMMFTLPSENTNSFYSVTIKVDTEQLGTLIPQLEKLWLTFNPDAKKPFNYQFVDQQFAKSYEKVQVQKQILLCLSSIVIFIALFGLFAVSSFNIGTKLREIAIRRILGADTKELIRKLSYRYLIYCIIGFGLSVFPSYYLLKEWLASYAYRIEIGYEVYGVCLVLIVALTLLIVVSRAYKATRVNVLDYIKYE